MDIPTGLGEVIVKSEDDVSLDCGCIPSERPFKDYVQKGIVVLDKPSGPSSHQISLWVRQMLGLQRAGHSGTLDPKVTGVLPVALGSATKIVEALVSAGKEYVGVMRLHDKVGEKKVESVFQEFTGRIYQKPPLKSAVKRELRIRRVYSFELLEEGGEEVVFDVSCEAGTYVRKLVHDAGLVLGCGAHMKELRRTRVGCFTEKDAVILQDLKDAFVVYGESGREDQIKSIIHPMEDAVAHMKKIWVKSSAVGALTHGAKLMAPGVARLHDSIGRGDEVALMTAKGEVVSLAESLQSSSEIMSLNKGVVAKHKRVIMEADVYPRIWGENK